MRKLLQPAAAKQTTQRSKLWKPGAGFLSADLSRKPRPLPPLHFSAEARRRFFNETIVLPKAAQITGFFERWGNYHPDQGDLAAAAGELYSLNLQRVVFDYGEGAESETAVEYLHESLGKSEIFDAMLRQIRRFPGTKLATELIFALEDLFLAQKLSVRAIQAAGTATPSRESALLQKISRKYAGALHKYSSAKFAELFDHKRFELLEELVKTTPAGYRAGDAFFRMGQIFWQQGCESGNQPKLDRAAALWQKAAEYLAAPGNRNREIIQNLNAALTAAGNTGALCATMPAEAALREFEIKRLTGKLRREHALLSAL